VATRSGASVRVLNMTASPGAAARRIDAGGFVQDAYFVNGTDKALLAAVVDDAVVVVDLADDVPPRSLPVQAHGSRVCAGTVDGADVLGWTHSGLAHIWDVHAAAPYRPSFPLTGWAREMAFANLGDRDLVLAMHKATVRAYNPQTGRLVTELPFGTTINAFSVLPGTTEDHLVLAIGGPGVMVTELWNR